MDFLNEPDHDFNALRSDPADYDRNYEYKMSCFSRRTIFAHTIISLREVRAKIQ